MYHRTPKINIVIPVFNQLDLTRACLTSVLNTIDKGFAEVVVVNDASTDAILCDYLQELESAGSIILIQQDVNLGFTRTVNVGMALNTDRDVILLNTDTVVYGAWVERLERAAYAKHSVATANPLTNSGGSHIAFYPAIDPNVQLDVSGKELDEMTSVHNSQRLICTHVTVGFCMYIKRACLDELGYFDATHFPRAYGEESDFCYRATYAGWKHVIAADVFVSHFHGKSFGSEKLELMSTMLKNFAKLHPQFVECDASFWARDPIKPARRALDMARLAAYIGKANGVLQVSAVAETLDQPEQPSLLWDEEKKILLFQPGSGRVGLSDLPHIRLPQDIMVLNYILGRLDVSCLFYNGYRLEDRLKALTRGEPYEIDWTRAVEQAPSNETQTGRRKTVRTVTKSDIC